MRDKTIDVFFALMRAGLWEKEVRLLPYQDIQWQNVYRLAAEQSVLGLVLAGLEHSDLKPPQKLLLQWIGEVQQIEQRNKAMNCFVAELIDRLRKQKVYCLLIKGQGIAQCYERPNWRNSGDIDLLLDDVNYDKAKNYMLSCSTSHQKEMIEDKHFEFSVNQWIVELHGDLPSHLSKKIDKTLRNIQDETFQYQKVRKWKNEGLTVFIPDPNNDVIFVFTHILKHFFRGGIGIRQICDWCRLLWTYKDEYDIVLLEKRLKRMGLISEWKAFASFVFNYLNMPVEALPLYSDASTWKWKADRILSFIMETGNFGHNRDTSYYFKYPLLVQKIISFWRHNSDILKYFCIFPVDSIKVWVRMLSEGIAEFKKF